MFVLQNLSRNGDTDPGEENFPNARDTLLQGDGSLTSNAYFPNLEEHNGTLPDPAGDTREFTHGFGDSV